MYKMTVDKSKSECYEMIEKNTFSNWLFNSGQLGYFSKINRKNNEFWLVDRASIYKSKNGFKYHSYERFEVSVTEINRQTHLLGEFKIQPIYKSTWTFFYMFLFLLSILICFSGNIIAIVQVFMMCFGLGIFGYLIILYNLKRGDSYQQNLINYLEGIMGTDFNSMED